jgi:5-methylcytosine-specific restriction endonuclease McrA
MKTQSYSGIRDIKEIINFEIYDLGNDDIPITLAKQGIIKQSDNFNKMKQQTKKILSSLISKGFTQAVWICDKTELPINSLIGFKHHHRLSIFLKKGIKCNNPNCGRVGTKIIKWRDRGKNIHWDIFTKDNKLMTIDHIIPLSKGGTGKIENKQILCCTCNSKKGNRLTMLNKIKYIHREFRFSIFRFSIAKLNNKFCFRCEISWGW